MPKNVVYLPCDPAVFGFSQMPVTLPAARATIKMKGVPLKMPMTIGEEIDEALKEWYAARGLPVPEDEVGVGAVIDAASAAEMKEFVEAYQKGEEEMPSVVPAYGTPEFWDYHRKKKAAENARRAAEGLPPLPTKKELEAEKAARKAEREAKKGAKKGVVDLAAGMAAMKIK
jgi:hypothetical protein